MLFLFLQLSPSLQMRQFNTVKGCATCFYCVQLQSSASFEISRSNWIPSTSGLSFQVRQSCHMATRKAVVCVTGAAGLLASWLVKRLLEDGYHVRGTVRDPAKASHLWELDGAKERLELKQADLTMEGAFDSIVEGCQGVFHTASQMRFTSENPEKEVEAAVAGTVNVLKSCTKSSSVKRVVLTSSSTTTRFPSGLSPDTVIDETSWSSVEFCRQNKLWYPLCKTLSEQAAWDFAKANNLDLVTVIPSFIVGPFLGPEPRTTVEWTFRALKGDGKAFDFLKQLGLIHVDDVASAHILAYENPEASGRYLCAATTMTNGELAEFLTKRYPGYKISTEFQPAQRAYEGFSRQRLEALGFHFKGPEEMFDDCLHSLKAKGFLL